MDPKTLLYRQINPAWIQEGGVASMAFAANVKEMVQSGAFVPSKKDEDKLSMYNGEVFDAKQSYEHFTEKFNSSGVLGLTVSEFQEEGLPCEADNTPFHGHVSVNYSGCKTRGERERKGKKLRDKALKRGWRYQPVVEVQTETSDGLNGTHRDAEVTPATLENKEIEANTSTISFDDEVKD